MKFEIEEINGYAELKISVGEEILAVDVVELAKNTPNDPEDPVIYVVFETGDDKIVKINGASILDVKAIGKDRVWMALGPKD